MAYIFHIYIVLKFVNKTENTEVKYVKISLQYSPLYTKLVFPQLRWQIHSYAHS